MADLLPAPEDDFLSLLEGQRSRLTKIARRMTRDFNLADDWAQSAITRAWVARARFQPGTSMEAWTGTILRRVALTDLMKKRRRNVQEFEEGQEFEAPGRAPEAVWTMEEIRADLDDRLRVVVDCCPRIYVTPLLLHSTGLLTCVEIGRRLGIPEGTVMSRIHRARKFIRRQLGREGSMDTLTSSKLEAAPDRTPADWRTDDQKLSDTTLEGNWYRCRKHGAMTMERGIGLGGEIYCPEDDEACGTEPMIRVSGHSNLRVPKAEKAPRRAPESIFNEPKPEAPVPSVPVLSGRTVADVVRDFIRLSKASELMSLDALTAVVAAFPSMSRYTASSRVAAAFQHQVRLGKLIHAGTGVYVRCESQPEATVPEEEKPPKPARVSKKVDNVTAPKPVHAYPTVTREVPADSTVEAAVNGTVKDIVDEVDRVHDRLKKDEEKFPRKPAPPAGSRWAAARKKPAQQEGADSQPAIGPQDREVLGMAVVSTAPLKVEMSCGADKFSAEGPSSIVVGLAQVWLSWAKEGRLSFVPDKP